jgi:endonuclease I
MQRNLLVFALFVMWGNMLAQIPNGYYTTATGLTGNALKGALHDIIDNHQEINYDAVKEALKILDEDPGNPLNIQLIYKGVSIPKADFNAGPDGWNREHLWPQSHGDFGTSNGAGTDLHALRPADVTVNTSRSDKDFDNGGTPHPEATGCYSDADSWEARDAVKGNVARAIFYMCTRYEGDSGDEPDLEIQDLISSPSSGNGYLGLISTLLQWHEQDPPDQSETDRNDLIYLNQTNPGLDQGNRNPFIDHPEYAGLIWGDEIAEEPTNHASDFSAHTITLNWDDATGATLPDGYLIRMSASGFEDISTPPDGTAVDNDFYNKNAAFGEGQCVFGGLTPNMMYYFKIFGYTGTGASIDYKTDGSVQQVGMEAI